MFKVVKKGGGPELDVYAIDCARFLAWIEDEDPHWEWLDLNEYEPAPVTATELFRLHDELVRRYEMFFSGPSFLPARYEPMDQTPHWIATRMYGNWELGGESHLNNVVPEGFVTIIQKKEEPQ